MANQLLFMPTPENYQGWTDARATSDLYVEDHEGLLRAIPPGELPFEKSRCVRNLWPQSDDSDSPTTQTITVIANCEYQLSIGATSASGATAVCSGAFTGTLTGDATNRKTFTAVKTATTTSLTVTITGSIANIQLENVTGQTIKIPPSEYQTADATNNGLAQYSTANGNSVDGSGNVTEATGAALSPVPYLRHVPAATNLVTHPSDLSDASWSTSSITVTSNDAIAPDGTYTADKITIAWGANEYINTTCSVVAATDYIFSFYAKRGTEDNLEYSVYDLSNYAFIVPKTSYYSQTSTSEWVRIEVAFTTPVGCISVNVAPFEKGYSGSDGTAYLWGAQLEATDFATATPIVDPYATASSSRNATALQTPLNTGAGGNFNQTEGALEITYVPEQDVNDLTAVMSVLDIGGTNAVLSHASGGAIQAKDGTNTADTPAAVHDAGDKITAGVAWDTTGNSLRVGYKNVTDATSWVWDADSANYDGGFDTSSGNIELFNGATNIYQIHSLVVQDAVATTAEIEAGLPAAGGGQYQLGLVTDTEATFAVSQSKDKTLGLLADTESVFSLSSTKTRDLGLLSDAEAVFALTSEKHYDLGLISDTESVFGIDSVKTQELGLVSDSEAVLSLNWDAVTTLGLVSDTETVYPIDNPGIIVLGLVVDTESVLPVSQQKESTLNLVTDTESVLPVSSGTAQTLGLVTDTEQVLSVSQEKQQTVGLVTDTESVLSVTGVSVRELGIITDSEISYPVDKIKWQQLGLVTSFESVFTLQGQQLIGLGAINDPAIYSLTTRKRIYSATSNRCAGMR